MAFAVEFVSPEDTLFSDEATQVVARTRGGGEIAFLSGHEPFVGSLMTCEVRVTSTDGRIKRYAVRGGFVSVTGTMTDTKVTVLSDAAEAAEDLDRATVESDLEAARQAVSANAEDAYARDDLRWAEVRLAAIDGAIHT